jgi:hypothetical protein
MDIAVMTELCKLTIIRVVAQDTHIMVEAIVGVEVCGIGLLVQMTTVRVVNYSGQISKINCKNYKYL